MVKLDYDRDYYADLELPATADAVEVKKQFKKLGRFRPRSEVDGALRLTRPRHSTEMAPRPQPGQGGRGQGEVPGHPVGPRNPDGPHQQVQDRCAPPANVAVPSSFWRPWQPLAVRRAGCEPEVRRPPEATSDADTPSRTHRGGIHSAVGLGTRGGVQDG
jgi:hypothetical protein